MKLPRPASPADVLLALLLVTDILLIIAHILWLTSPYFQNYNYSLVQERGFGETFQYFKAFWLLLMFAWLAIIARQFSYLSWAAVFGYLGLDDLMEIHEEFGNDIAMRYEISSVLGQRPRDIGEIIVFALAGAALLLLLAIAWYLGSETFRERSKTLLKLSAVLAFFGIGMDAVHILFLDTALDEPFAIIEDGGEMIVLSVIVWFVLGMLWSDIEPGGASDEEEPPVYRSKRRKPRHVCRANDQLPALRSTPNNAAAASARSGPPTCRR